MLMRLKMDVSLAVLFVLVATCSTKGLAKSQNERFQEYLEQILDNPEYDKRVPPPASSLGPVSPINVTVTMYILDINKIDADKQEFEAQFYFRQLWTDPRLRYPEDREISVALREVDKIWTPDVFFVNEKKGELRDMIQPNVFLRIKPNGSILYSVRLTERLQCLMDLRKFPFDTQKCQLRAESYGYTRDKVDFSWGPVGVSSDISEDEFVIVENKTEAVHETFSSGEYGILILHLSFQRKFGYYARRLYAPLAALVLLSWLPLWIKSRERYLRLTFLLVILYLMVTVTSGVDASVPRTSYTKAIDVWTGFCGMMVFAAFLEFLLSCVVADKAADMRAKGEIMRTLDPEGKETNVNVEESKSRLSKFIVMFEARNGGKGGNNLPHRIDKIARIVLPSVFLVFNIIYWLVCCLP